MTFLAACFQRKSRSIEYEPSQTGFWTHVFGLWEEIRAPELNPEPSVLNLLSQLIGIWVKGQSKRIKGSFIFWATIKSSPFKVSRSGSLYTICWNEKRKVREWGAQEEPNSDLTKRTMTTKNSPDRQQGWRINSEIHEIGEAAEGQGSYRQS